MSLYTYRAHCSRVVDADTIDLEWIDLGFGVQQRPTMSQSLRMRFAYVNAYETTRRGGTTVEQKALGLEAKAWLKDAIEGREILIRSVKGGASGNFGRFLVWVWPGDYWAEQLTEADSLNMAIIDYGWGVPYER